MTYSYSSRGVLREQDKEVQRRSGGSRLKPSEDTVACIRKLRMDQGEGGDKRGVRGSALVAGLVPKDQEFARTDQYGCPLHVDLPPSPPARSVSLSLCFHLASLLWAACLLLFLSLPPSPSLPLACSPLLFFPSAILIALFLPRKLYVTPHAFYPYSSCFPHQFLSLSLFHSRSFPLPRSRESVSSSFSRRTYTPGFIPVFATIAGGSFLLSFRREESSSRAFSQSSTLLALPILPQPSLVALTLYIVCVYVYVYVCVHDEALTRPAAAWRPAAVFLYFAQFSPPSRGAVIRRRLAFLHSVVLIHLRLSPARFIGPFCSVAIPMSPSRS